MKSIFILLFVFVCSTFSQQIPISNFTKKEVRDSFYLQLKNHVLINNLQLELTDSNIEQWIEAFWAAGLILEKSPIIKESLAKVISDEKITNINLIRSALESAYTLYPSDFTPELKRFILRTDNPKLFAMSALHLFRNNFAKDSLLNILRSRFPDFTQNPILKMLASRLSEDKKLKPPPIKELVLNTFPNESVIFVFQRKQRDFIGRAIIRNHKNQFEIEDTKIFSIPVLARAISDLPGFITNGNTPQGIFSIQGTAYSSNRFIGSTENIQTVLPFEVKPSHFFHDSTIYTDEFSHQMYKNMLPKNWQEYFPIYEAFYAGKAGRNEIIFHGTTVDTSYYTGKPYAPYTPTLGCICSLELWDENSGERIFSDQQKFMDRFSKMIIKPSYLVVVEIDDLNSSISQSEIEELLKD
ncbi:MAG: hypothetical protein KF721_13745 [Ignavibacteriaceae bacterium]|nr:hypothetical protein [Ignavibacteriaceae bacterium]